MKTINRSALVLHAKRPFLQWVNGLGAPPLTIDELRKDPSVYLIPGFEDDELTAKYLVREFDIFFQEQLSSWWIGEEHWPANRTFKLFEQWFDYNVHGLVFDAVKERLVREELG